MSREVERRSPASSDPSASGAVQLLQAELERLLLAHDTPAAVAAALGAVRDGRVTIPELYTDVLGPTLVAIGDAWHTGEVAVWEEHLASAAVRTIVEALYPEVWRACQRVPNVGRSALLACPPEEAHDLGLRMLADRLRLAGWRVHFLGADTPLAEMVEAARGLQVDAILLSSSTHFHRVRVRELVDELTRLLPGVDVWVGGPAFIADLEDWPREHLFDASVLCPPEAPAAGAPEAVGGQVPSAHATGGGEGLADGGAGEPC